MDPAPGRLLVATPNILDPNFARTVVLVCASSEEGMMGLILNRMTGMDAAEALPGWEHRLATPKRVFIGGPVHAEGLIGLGRRTADLDEHDWTEVVGGVGIVNLNEQVDRLGGAVSDLRIFAGFAGWDAGQLEGEIGRGDWFIVSSAPDDLFTTEPDGLWRRVLRRQQNHLAWYGDFPPDPRLN